MQLCTAQASPHRKHKIPGKLLLGFTVTWPTCLKNWNCREDEHFLWVTLLKVKSTGLWCFQPFLDPGSISGVLTWRSQTATQTMALKSWLWTSASNAPIFFFLSFLQRASSGFLKAPLVKADTHKLGIEVKHCYNQSTEKSPWMPGCQAPGSAALCRKNRQSWPGNLHISSGMAFGVETSVYSIQNCQPP